jgi:manganese/zinc/iron transport system ATP- binding protein
VILDVHDLTVAYHRKPALWDVDWQLHEPQLVGVIGPNGAPPAFSMWC